MISWYIIFKLVSLFLYFLCKNNKLILLEAIFITNLLIKLFVKDYQNTVSTVVRTRYGLLSGSVGIAVNLLLFTAKIITGSVTGSISIVTDAVNNLSDAGSSIVTLLGFKLSDKPADEEHPFGHGRIEYIAALIVSFIIVIVGVELAHRSFDKIRDPDPVTFSYLASAILISTMAAKLWLAFFYQNIGRRINSPAMKAVVADSLSDIAATGSTLFVLVFSRFNSFPIDGYIGLAVSVFVFLAGIGIIRNTIGPLLGEPPDEDFVKSIEEEILSYDSVIGIHDLMLHNYGPGRVFGSVHAEVPANMDIMISHDTIDLIERKIKKDFGIEMVIHMDPIVVDDEHIDRIHALVLDMVLEIDESLAIHDFRVVDGLTHTNLVFDLVTPHNFPMKSSRLIQEINERLTRLNEKYFAVITVEQGYTKRAK